LLTTSVSSFFGVPVAGLHGWGVMPQSAPSVGQLFQGIGFQGFKHSVASSSLGRLAGACQEVEFAGHARRRGAARDVEVAVISDPEALAVFHLSGAVIVLR